MKKLLFIFLLLIATPCFGATVTWQGDESALWSTGGNWDTGTKPAAGDDVVIPVGTGACQVNENTANLKSFDMTGYANTLSGSSSINVIGAATSTDVVKFAGTITWTGTLNLNPTAADTNIELTSNGKTISAITQNGNNAGDVYFIDNLTLSGICTLTQGNLHFDGTSDTSGLTHSFSSFSSGGSSTRRVYLGNSTTTCTATSNAWNCAVSGFTVTCGNSTIIINGNGTTFKGSDQTYATVTFNTGTGTRTIAGNNSFGTLNFAGSANKTDILSLSGNNTVTGTLNIDGNSAINRVLVASDTLGTARTLTLTGATVSGCSNVDFRDITFAGSPDFSGITGGSGDCGGNTGGTLTTADDWYWNGSGTRNFSDYTYWYTATNGGGSQMASTRCPLPQDTCYFDGDSIDGATTVDQDLPRIPGIDFTGVDAMNFHTNNINQTCYGSLLLVANVTWTTGSNSLTFEGRSNYQYNTGGKSGVGGSLNINMISGSLTLTGDANYAATITLNYGTFDADTYNISSTVDFNSSNSNARTLLMGSGTWSFLTDWNMATTTNLTNPTTMGETSTISWGLATSTTARTFAGGGCTYNNLSVVANTTGTQVMTISGSNTFNTLTINAPKTVKFTAGTTQTVSSFVATGDAGNLIHIDSTSASAATLSDTTGTNTVHYCHIGETGAVNAEGGATWDATDNCEVNSSTGWTTAAGGAVSLPINSMANGISQGIGRGMR